MWRIRQLIAGYETNLANYRWRVNYRANIYRTNSRCRSNILLFLVSIREKKEKKRIAIKYMFHLTFS